MPENVSVTGSIFFNYLMLLIADMVEVDEAAVTEFDHRAVLFVNLTDSETMRHLH